ncbi:MAG: nucleotidyltransferase family protein [Anaerolineae bacterium]
MSVTPDLTPEAMAVYRATARRRWEADQRERAQRHERAWETAHQAAALLKEQFGATQVMVFGSLVHDDWFSETSDVDLAAWGLKGDEYFIAVARLQDLSSEFEVDLVAMEHCKPGLQSVVMEEGKPL